MKIAIVGAGVAGLAAALDLLAAGHEITLWEAADYTGGLAAGFCDDRWDWPLERYYHHLFTSDRHIIGLVDELGMTGKLFFPRPITSVIYENKILPFDSPKAWITFPAFSLVDVVRFGLVSAYLRFSNPWRRLERVTADSWLRRWYGTKIYETLWRPLLIGKFGFHYEAANMAWMWARLKVRSPRLGYFIGGFQAFVDRLTERVQQLGGRIMLNCPVDLIEPEVNGQLTLSVNGLRPVFDRCLLTTSPGVLRQMVTGLPEDYAAQLTGLKSMGAVVLVLALKHRLMKETYWLNLPADSPDKSKNEFPFLALVEHTNYIERERYGGDYLVYCGDYVAPDHPYFDMTHDQLERQFIGVLPKINKEFRPEWLRKSWLFRTRYAQPVPEINHSLKLPSIQTPIRNLFLASMSQVYPWDRGTNYAVEIGRRAARLILSRS